MNLILTCARNLEHDAENEIKQILDELGDNDPKVTITSMSGILTCITKLDPLLVVKKIKEKIMDEPWSVRYCLRLIPIQKIAPTNVEDISGAIENMIPQMKKDATYRITIEKRNSNISKTEIITKIANKIENKVSLEHPDLIVMIEILGNTTGISIIKKNSIFSMEKQKRSLSE